MARPKRSDLERLVRCVIFYQGRSLHEDDCNWRYWPEKYFILNINTIGNPITKQRINKNLKILIKIDTSK